MTPDQIDTLAQMIANSLPNLVKEKMGPQSKPIQPKNIGSLYVEKDDVKNVIVAYSPRRSQPLAHAELRRAPLPRRQCGLGGGRIVLDAIDGLPAQAGRLSGTDGGMTPRSDPRPSHDRVNLPPQGNIAHLGHVCWVD